MGMRGTSYLPMSKEQAAKEREPVRRRLQPDCRLRSQERHDQQGRNRGDRDRSDDGYGPEDSAHHRPIMPEMIAAATNRTAGMSD
jgi:hypothetical protein